MTNRTRRPRRSTLAGAAGAVLLVAGVVAVIIGVRSQVSVPEPPASAAVPVAVTPSRTGATTGDDAMARNTAAASSASSSSEKSNPDATPDTTPTPAAAPPPPPAAPAPAGQSPATGPTLPRSKPATVTIPAIGVTSVLEDIGLTASGEITTPPLEKNSHAYWLDVSPTPGELGPAVILGHVDSAKWGPAVFFDLGQLRQHDRIEVARADGTVAIFAVTHVNQYKKADFPTLEVYGNTDRAALRLITCGGDFDSAERSYESNIVVYADLVDVRPAG